VCEGSPAVGCGPPLTRGSRHCIAPGSPVRVGLGKFSPAPFASRRLTEEEPEPHNVDPRQLLETHHPLFERLILACARAHGLGSDERKDFKGYAFTRFVDSDYKVLRAFKGRSKLTTFLTTVIGRFYADFIGKERGRWRTSAEAERLGPVAIQLEKLIHRDGYPVGEAIDHLLRTHPSLSARELQGIVKRLPARPERVGNLPDKAGTAVAGNHTDDVVTDLERHRFRHLLNTVIGDLPSQDRVMLRFYYEEAIPLAEIARFLEVEPRLLYRRFEQVKLKLRGDLERRGIDASEARDLMDKGGL
jgi:RNA polymerase sigma factor (sigma-70 family)